MDFPKEFESNIWPLIRDHLPRGEKTNALNEIKNEIRNSEIKDSNTIKTITWKIIKKYFGLNVINNRSKETINKKIDRSF